MIAMKEDLHADAVADKIFNDVIVIRLDPFDVLPALSYSANADRFRIGDQTIYFRNVTAIFCRCALEAITYNHISDPVVKFSACEHFGALIGILLQIPEEKWFNYPWNESRVDGKIYPLVVAKTCGIEVPDFICESSNEQLRLFAQSGSVIIKPFSDMSIAKQNGAFVEVPDFEEFSAPYTSDFDASVLDSSDQVTPVLLQRKIDAAFEVRVTLVDDRVFATKVERDASVTDVRIQRTRNEQIFAIDDAFARKIIRLATEKLKLRFVTMDFLVDKKGVLKLIDVNPSGNWLWQEQIFRLPISNEIAKALSDDRSAPI